jgi:hypothetical protein
VEAPEATETSGFLLAQARKAGFSVKAEKLRRWQRRGLLPRVQRHGLGRARGTESVYPAGSAKQLVALCAQLKKRRVLRDAAWAIWWEGYWVEKGWVVDRLVRQLAYIQLFFTAWAGDENDTSGDLLEQLVHQSQAKRLPTPMGNIRRSLGQEAYSIFVVLLSRVVGEDLLVLSDLEREPEIMADSLGSKDRRETETDLQAASKTIDFPRLRDALVAATFEDLCEARDEMRGVLNNAYPIIADILDAVGLSRIALFSKALDPSNSSTAANAVLVWLRLRRSPTARRAYEVAAPLLHQVANRELSIIGAMKRFDQIAAEKPPP